MRYRIEHHCRILYPAPVREHHCQVRLAPWDDSTQSLSRLELRVHPEADVAASYDGFGNLAQCFAVIEAHRDLAFSLTAEVETRLANPFDFEDIGVGREPAWLAESLHQAPRLWDFIYHRGRLTPQLPEVIAGVPTPPWRDGVATLGQVQEALQWVQSVAGFDPLRIAAVSDLPELFAAGEGSAADLAHLLIALVRGWGVPARFVSGYQDPAWCEPDDEDPEGTPPRPQALHYWADVLIPGAGWRGFDPAFAVLADDSYIRVAVGRELTDVNPLRQTCRGAVESPELTRTLAVMRLEGAASAGDGQDCSPEA